MIRSATSHNFKMNRSLATDAGGEELGRGPMAPRLSLVRDLPQSPYDYADAWRLPTLPIPLLLRVGKFTGAERIFKKQPQPQTFSLSGVTRDSTGAVLANCVVNLFATTTNAFIATVTSDANGAYSFSVASPGIHQFIVSYKSGSPDVAGTSLNNLYGS